MEPPFPRRMARLLRRRTAPLFILTPGKVRMAQGCFQLSFALQSALGMPLRMRGQEQSSSRPATNWDWQEGSEARVNWCPRVRHKGCHAPDLLAERRN